ncbi:MAG TPA: IS1380 family transposase [Caldimonas sp.]|nr:IS1380 family transposase [Caldimonas sp.]
MRVTRDGRDFTVDVTADGEGLVSHAGSALLARVADRTGLTRALSRELGALQLREGSHDRGRVVRDLAVMLADGGDCLADMAVVRDQGALFGRAASDSTAFRVIDQIASHPEAIDWLRAAHARARARVWELVGAPERLTIDLDATLLTAHSDKEGAEPTWKRGYGFHPMLAYGDQTGEALAGELRPGNAGAGTAADQITVAEGALAQIPAEHIEDIEILLRVDSAGACHELLNWCRDARIGYSVGFDLTEPVRDAIEKIADEDWVCSLDQDGAERPNGQVCEITEHLDLTGWPTRSRVLVRRERAHPGAQLSFTDHDGHRFQAILTDQTGAAGDIEQGHRGRARVEDHIRNDKDTGLRNLPFRDFEHNRVWLELVRIAHDLIAWTKRLLLTGELARAEPKRLRYRLLHVAARLAFHARTATLRLQASWRWATDLAAAFHKLKALPAPA